MKLRVFIDKSELIKEVADVITETIKANPKAKFIWGLNKELEELYPELIRRYRSERLNFSECIFINSAEFIQAPKKFRGLCSFMRKNFYDNVNINPAHVFFPAQVDEREDTVNLEKYNSIMDEQEEIDLAIVTLGWDGAIGMLGPESDWKLRTHVQYLKYEAISHHYGSGEDIYPYFTSIGIGDFLNAKRIIIIGLGDLAARHIFNLSTQVSKDIVPLHAFLNHENVTIFTDRKGASLI